MILISYGTRPEWIKIKPLIEAFKLTQIPYKVLFTGQHTHIANFGYDYKLDIHKHENRLNEVISSILRAPSNIFDGIEYVLVQGDTASTYAVGLSAYNHGIKVIHLEAGLRTYDLDNPCPEEAYRQMLSRIASIHFCATNNNKNYLETEKVSGEIYVVGNTVLDNLRNVSSKYGDHILITMHRRENLPIMKDWFEELNNLAAHNKDLKFILPMHPNPEIQKHRNLLTNVEIVDPLSYENMIESIATCKFIISDSGGIQEEASFLNKRVIVCRKFTERTESIGGHSILCKSPGDLKERFEQVKTNFQIDLPSPYGDGFASHKICNILKNHGHGEYMNTGKT
jgi:UDP-N-acetylglucosamine 2-epimerase (non-hydrolysing)